MKRLWCMPCVTAGLLGALFSLNARAQIEAQPDLRQIEEQQRQQQDATAKPGRMTRAPKLIYTVPPRYPPSARQQQRGGTVVMRIHVDDEGFVSRVEVLKSAGRDLDLAAMGAVCNFVFDPGQVDGVPAPVSLDYQQRFVFSQTVHTVVDRPEETADAVPTQDDTNAPPAQTPALLNYTGSVREAGTKNVLREAEVSVIVEDGSEPRVAYTDADGHFLMRGVPAGEHMVRVALTGYEAFLTTETFADDERITATYYIPRRTYNKFETVVRDVRPNKEVNRVVLRRQEVSQVAGSFGDPLRVIENMPGMARAPLLGGQLLVRGASPRSTGVYMDGVQVPLLYHFGGLTSVVNANFLETIDFYSGGFGAQYGRATAGIVDVKSRNLQFDGIKAAAKIDMFDSGFFFGAPLTLWGPPVASDAPNPRRLTFAVAARRSYIDALIPLALAIFLPPGAGAVTVAPIYWDYQAKLEYRPVAEHTFSLFAFGSDDNLKVIAGGTADGSGFGVSAHTQFHRLVARWTWRIAPRLTNTFQAYAGADLTNLGFGGGGVNVGQDTLTRAAGMRNELAYQVFDLLKLNAGLDYSVSSTRLESGLLGLFGGFDGPGNFGDGGGTPSVLFAFTQFPRVFSRIQGDGFEELAAREPAQEDSVDINAAPYVEAEVGPVMGIKAIAGVRFDYFEYGQGRQEWAPSPRLALRAEPLKGTVLKATYGVYEQSPASLQVSPSVGNPNLRTERARHYIVGLEQRLTPFISLQMNAFYNSRAQMVSNSARYDIADGVVSRERYSNDGIGRSYGMDLMLRHELTSSFFGWISYTLSRSENRAKPKQPYELFQYDQTHILTAVGQYKVPWRLPFREWSKTGKLPRGVWWNTGWAILSGDVSVGGRWRFVTGNPATFFSGAINDLDTDEWVATKTRTGRLPAFHQLDIRIDYKMAFENWLLNLYVDIINVYNRQNPEAISWDYRYSSYETISILPFLPIFGMSAEF